MADKPDHKETVTTEELLMAQMVQLDAISQLLIEKGVISPEEFYTKLRQVQAEYRKASGS